MVKLLLYCVIAMLVVSLLLRLSQILYSPLAIVVRSICGMAMIALGFLAFSILQVARAEGWAGGYVIAALIFALCLFIFVRLYRTRSVPNKSLAAPEYKRAGVAQSIGSWPKIERYLSWSERRRVRHAHATINAFIAEEGSPSFSTDHTQLLLSLKTRVPQMLEELLKRCERASISERAQYAKQFCETLEKLARAAELARSEVRKLDDRQLEVFNTYFSDVVEPRA